MFKNILLITFLISQTALFAQNRYGVDPVGGVNSYNITSYGITEDEFLSAEGSPYLDKEFSYGTIVNDGTASKAYMRYNIFFEEIEIKTSPSSKEISGLTRSTDISAVFNDRTYVFLLMGKGEEQRGVYFQVLTSGTKFDLYSKSSVKYREPKYAKTSLEQDRPGKFTVTNTYFLVSKQKRFIPLPKKHKDLLKMISAHNEDAKNYLKKNRIKLDKEEDVIKFVKFYNTL